MSTLSVTTINSANGTTDFTMASGNTSAGKFVISSSGGFTLHANSSVQVANVDGGKFYILKPLHIAPGASVTPINNGDVVIEFTNNTTLTFKAKGSDGTVRSGTVALS